MTGASVGHGPARSLAEIDLGPLPRGVFVDHGRRGRDRRPSRARLGETLRRVRRSATLVVRPRLVALDGLFCDAGRHRRRRTQAAPAAVRRVRLPLGPGVRAGRVAAACPLADECAPRAAHGEGARGHGPRRRASCCSTAIRLAQSACRRTRASTWRCARPARSCRHMPRADARRRSSRPASRSVDAGCALRTASSAPP